MLANAVEPIVPAQSESLVESITALFVKLGHTNPAAWVAGLHEDVHKPSTPVDVQRFLINRYWRVQIGAILSDTMDVRYCLVDTGSIKDYLRIFEQGVAPCIIKNNLPLAKN